MVTLLLNKTCWVRGAAQWSRVFSLHKPHFKCRKAEVDDFGSAISML